MHLHACRLDQLEQYYKEGARERRSERSDKEGEPTKERSIYARVIAGRLVLIESVVDTVRTRSESVSERESTLRMPHSAARPDPDFFPHISLSIKSSSRMLLYQGGACRRSSGTSMEPY